MKILIIDSNQLWQAKKTRTSIWKLETMTPLSNISLNKIFEKIACMFMKQNYGHVFQLVKGCYALIGIRHYELNGEISNIVAQMSPKCRNVLGP